MTRSKFRVVPLSSGIAEEARRQAASGASGHTCLTADVPNAYPCRHCLQWAKPGERVVLFTYNSLPPGRPYSESGPIFVHADACAPYAATDRYPENFRSHRVLRAYDENDDMIDAVVVDEEEPEVVIDRLLQNPRTAFLQARSVTRGCFTFRIERT
jgi:hypothetical protein